MSQAAFRPTWNRTILGAAIAFGLAVSACSAPPTEDSIGTEPLATIEEIPVTTSSDAARSLFEEGQYLLDVGRGVTAREKFQAAITEDPGFVQAHFNQSNASLSFKEFQDCLDMASEHLDPVSDGERMMVEINRTFLTNDPQRGVDLASELTTQYPNSPRALILLAGMQTGQNDAAGARRSFEAALELDPQSAGALFGIANNYLFNEPKDFARAEDWAAQAIATYPDEAKAHELMGDIMRAQDDLETALASYNHASKLDPALGAAHHKRGHVNSFLGNIEEARAAYDSGVGVAPPENRGGFAVFKTFTRIHEGNIPAALDELEQLADSLADLGTPEDQIKGLQVFAMNSHATAAMHAGLLDRAAESVARGNELRMAIAEEVGTDDARRLQKAGCHNWDGLLAAYRGDAAMAAEHAAAIAAIVEGDDNPRKMEPVHWILGISSLTAGDYSTAADHLHQADHANNMYVRYQLANSEAALGNTDEARRMFGEIGRFNFNSVGFALVGRDARAKAAG